MYGTCGVPGKAHDLRGLKQPYLYEAHTCVGISEFEAHPAVFRYLLCRALCGGYRGCQDDGLHGQLCDVTSEETCINQCSGHGECDSGFCRYEV